MGNNFFLLVSQLTISYHQANLVERIPLYSLITEFTTFISCFIPIESNMIWQSVGGCDDVEVQRKILNLFLI